jgi:FkbM family methyltransferase
MASMNNWYGKENWDAERFGPHKSSWKAALVTKFNELFSWKVTLLPAGSRQQEIEKVSRLEGPLGGLTEVYELLEDESSKATLVKVLAYRIMGHEKVKLPLNTASYWAQREAIRCLSKDDSTIKVKFPDISLNHLMLDKLGYPIELYFSPSGAMATFVLRQYEYGKRNPAIKAQPGDHVIDAGGCWGDTALYFADRVGEQGRVHTFEFMPENLEILRRNLALNPALSQRIAVVPRALWDKSGEALHYFANGPATSLKKAWQDSEDNNDHECPFVNTITIDDFVSEGKLPHVDFIKMDIEGAELSALKGAEETIRTFKPKLAISLYHRDTDFIEIPTYLERLGVGYEFFLDHFTIYGEETILFAAPQQ